MTLADVVSGSSRWHVQPCDCRYGMASMPDACVDAIVCDPPYELGFMSKRWDRTGIAYDPDVWREALRILKPGGHLVAFGGTRTYHRMTCAIEDAGFEVRDCLAWMYGSGFPKSLNVSKAIDAAATGGSRPEDIRRMSMGDDYTPSGRGRVNYDHGGGSVMNGASAPTDPVSDAARSASGYGTALKPAFEPAVLARKPLAGTVAANFMAHGTGALNVDGCRLEWASEEDKAAAAAAAAAQRACLDQNANRTGYGDFNNGPASLAPYLDKMNQGRWPANVLLDEAAAAILDAQTGDRPSGIAVTRNGGGRQIWGAKNTDGPVPDSGYSDNGGPSRFFYTSKASRSERDAGLDDFAAATAGEATDREDGTAALNSPRTGAGRTGGARNTHPTVKPVDVMRWLVRLVSRPGSLILDPFCGSGSTGIATMLEGEGRRFVGMELDPKHVDFARARIAHVVGGTWKPEVTELQPAKAGQISLFGSTGT